jgi:hypothetical protein
MTRNQIFPTSLFYSSVASSHIQPALAKNEQLLLGQVGGDFERKIELNEAL